MKGQGKLNSHIILPCDAYA